MTADQIADIKSALANADALVKQAQWTRQKCREICDHTHEDGSSAFRTGLYFVEGQGAGGGSICTICGKFGED